MKGWSEEGELKVQSGLKGFDWRKKNLRTGLLRTPTRKEEGAMVSGTPAGRSQDMHQRRKSVGLCGPQRFQGAFVRWGKNHPAEIGSLGHKAGLRGKRSGRERGLKLCIGNYYRIRNSPDVSEGMLGHGGESYHQVAWKFVSPCLEQKKCSKYRSEKTRQEEKKRGGGEIWGAAAGRFCIQPFKGREPSALRCVGTHRLHRGGAIAEQN